jgi:hypothetical protein
VGFGVVELRTKGTGNVLCWESGTNINARVSRVTIAVRIDKIARWGGGESVKCSTVKRLRERQESMTSHKRES